MIRRLAASLVVLCAVVAVSSGCGAVPATAARVGDTRIPMSRVDELYTRAAADPAAKEFARRFPAQTRQAIVDTLIGVEFLRRATASEGIVVGSADVAQARAQVAASQRQLVQRVRMARPQDFAQLTSDQAKELAKLLLPIEVLAADQAYRAAVGQRMQAGQPDQERYNQRVTAFLARAAKEFPVTVNPRFGTFDPQRFFNSETPGLAPPPEVAVTRLPTGPAEPS